MYGVLEIEQILQVNDKTRIDASKTYTVKGEAAITVVEIEPYTGAGYVTVSGVGITARDWYLDYQYPTAGLKTISLRVTTNAAPEVFTKTILVLTEADDRLFSSDNDLVQHEPDIMKWLRAGRNSWLDYHRRSQGLILDWLAQARIFDQNGDRLTKVSILVIEDIKNLSIYWTLGNIFLSLSNKPDDVFRAKSEMYFSLVADYKSTGRIQFDYNNDGELNDSEKNYDLKSFRIVRR